MKRILAVVIALVLMCGMLVSCENAEAILEKADAALLSAPYKVIMKFDFECDNEELNEVFSLMNMEVPVTVDGKNIAMDMSMDIAGTTASSKMIVADMVLYYNIEAMGQVMKMKTTLTDEQYEEFMDDSNTEMIIEPDDFSEFTIENKDGKKVIACGKISDEALEDLNELMDESLGVGVVDASVNELSYSITISDGKYDAIDMSCSYSVTSEGETYNVTLNLTAKYSYEGVERVTVPADADSYQEWNYTDIIG